MLQRYNKILTYASFLSFFAIQRGLLCVFSQRRHGSQAVRDSDMTIPLGVDALHLPAEEFAVGGGVVELVDGDVIMNHLMEDGILNEFFG